MILTLFAIIVILAGGYFAYLGASSLFSETEGTGSSRLSRTFALVVGLLIVGLGIAMLTVL